MAYGPLTLTNLAGVTLGNYAIGGNSPAIDAATAGNGTNGFAPKHDFFGTPRPQGRAIDIGAVEFVGSAAAPAVTLTALTSTTFPDVTLPVTAANAPTLDFRLSNAGPGSFTVGSITVGSAPFTRISSGGFPTGAPNCGGTLASGATCTIRARFFRMRRDVYRLGFGNRDWTWRSLRHSHGIADDHHGHGWSWCCYVQLGGAYQWCDLHGRSRQRNSGFRNATGGIDRFRDTDPDQLWNSTFYLPDRRHGGRRALREGNRPLYRWRAGGQRNLLDRRNVQSEQYGRSDRNSDCQGYGCGKSTGRVADWKLVTSDLTETFNPRCCSLLWRAASHKHKMEQLKG